MGSRSPVIPRPADPFIRSAEGAQPGVSLLTAHRLVTLAGAAGTGQARLALREERERSLLETLIDALASRSLLLVWDNCHASVEGCWTLAHRLLQAWPGVHILATCRRSLHLPGEVLYSVPPVFELGVASTNGRALALHLEEAAEPAAVTAAWDLELLSSRRLGPPVLPPDLVPRPRLTDALEPAPGSRLALVVAPPGSGKSSLIAQWCERHEGPVAWLPLDDADNDPAHFLLHLCAAVESGGHAAAPVRALLRSSPPPAPAQALRLLLQRLAASEQSLALVLDDCHLIEGRAVEGLLGLLVEHLPRTVFLILASRSDPPLPLARLRLNGQLIEIRAADLRFTREEVVNFLTGRMGLTLRPEMVDRLADRTEGWIAGLYLAALSLQGVPDAGPFVEAFTGSNRYLVDYLCEEVLRRQSPEVERFLFETAILERFCAPLCDAVTGGTGSQVKLERLEAANLFLVPLDAERRWYRYHQLFAAVLRARLLATDPDRAPELHRRAAAWFEAEGLTDEAIEHALAARDWERAAELIGGRCEGLWRQGEWSSLKRWLAALPPAVIRTDVRLSLALANLHNHDFCPTEAERVLARIAVEVAAGTPETEELTAGLLTMRAWTARLLGDADRAAPFARRACQLLPRDSRAGRSAALLTLGVLGAASGELPAAAGFFAEALRDAERGDHPSLWLMTSNALGQLREAQGALNEAARVYERAIQYAADRGFRHTPPAAMLYAGLGRIAYERNDLAAAVAYLDEALQHSIPPSGEAPPVYAVLGLFDAIRIRRALREDDRALVSRLIAVARAIPEARLESLVDFLRVQSGWDAGPWLADYEARAGREGWPVLPVPDFRLPDCRALETLTWAQLRLAEVGRAEGWAAPAVEDERVVLVRARLERCLERMEGEGRHGGALGVRLAVAALAWQAGRREHSVSLLEPALALAVREGYVRPFVEAGSGLVPVLRQAVAQGIAAEFARTLLAPVGASGRGPGAPDGAAASQLDHPLSERELEVLRLLSVGLSNKEIAAQLFLSVGTVKQHLHHINGKLDATSRTSAVARARAQGLLP